MSSYELTKQRRLESGSKNAEAYENTAFNGDEDVDNPDKVKENVENGYTTRVEEDYSDYNAYHRSLMGTRSGLFEGCRRHKKVLLTALAIFLALWYFAYIGYALYYRFGDEGSWRLLGFTIFAVLLVVLIKLCGAYEEPIDNWWESTQDARHSKRASVTSSLIKWFLRLAAVGVVVVYIIVDIAIDHPENLVTLGGLALYILIFYVTSINPAKVNWHTVFWGMALQYLFALLILRTQTGYDIFKWLGDRVTEFLDHTVAGIIFVFGEKYTDHFFAMKVLSIVIFFFTVINILYYLGVMQAVVKVIGKSLAFCMGTTPAESINAAANIFVSMTESPLMIRPFLKDMTNSELHAVMTGGFATIAGSVLGAYISFGVPANHLLSASVMSAPAALAISKLSYPETELSTGSSKDFDKMEKAPEHNLVEAASNGATASLKVIGAIATNVLAFLSLLAFMNATLTWFGDRAGVEGLTFEFICSYVLYPVSYFMGADTDDCRKVAELIGVKTFTNEFIAYGKLKDLISNRVSLNNYTASYNTTAWYWSGDDVHLNITGDVLKGGIMSEKSEIISTYALCGFANFGSIGITLGGLGALVPSRRQDLTKMVVRAMICGNVACFLTACVAGLLYKPF